MTLQFLILFFSKNMYFFKYFKSNNPLRWIPILICEKKCLRNVHQSSVEKNSRQYVNIHYYTLMFTSFIFALRVFASVEEAICEFQA